MAQKYRKVDPRIWTDENFRRLGANEKLLALWMLTSTRVNRCGIVLWSPGLASEETGIMNKDVDAALHTVCDTLNWVLDSQSNTVFLSRWWRYNRPDNCKALIGALSDLHDVPCCGLRSSLVDATKDLPASMHETYIRELNTVSDTVCDTVAPQEQEQEQEQEQNTRTLSRVSLATNKLASLFATWWAAYPRRTGKLNAEKSYGRALAALTSRFEDDPDEAAEWLLERTTLFAGSVAGQAGKFCPHPATWLNQGRYDDDEADWNVGGTEADDLARIAAGRRDSTDDETEFLNHHDGGPFLTEVWPDGTKNTDGIWHNRDLTRWPLAKWRVEAASQEANGKAPTNGTP